jgi:general secretion pathway protein G
MLRRTTRRAFTLIELLLVLVILAVLAAVVIPKLTGRVSDSKRKATIAQIANIESALATYENDNGGFPDPADGLSALVSKPANAGNGWHQLLKDIPTDSWGNPFTYVIMDNGEPNVISNGENGTYGDEDDLDIHTKAE